MLSSTLTTVCNVLSLVFFLLVVILQMLEVNVYTGSLLGFFQ